MADRRERTWQEIADARLRNQRLAGAKFGQVAEAVGWFGAVQAQDYGGAKWGLAQRVKGCAEGDVDAAFDRGEILRTHVLRPTWHFVLPADIRMLLALTAPRVKAASAYYWKRAGLDERSFAKAERILVAALGGARHQTRAELGRLLGEGGLPAAGEPLGLVLMRAELDAVICSGPRRGKQFTYALLEERAEGATALPREQALAALCLRYFQSHGPALAQDFAWWSGLTVADARAAIASCAELQQVVVEGRTFFALPARRVAPKRPLVHLLPNYDEHVIAYKDHAATLDPALRARLSRAQGVLANHLVALDGRVIGGWRRTFEQGHAVLSPTLLTPLTGPQRTALQTAATHYAHYLRLPTRISK
jgi:Winged helix DNA-binding domain